MRREGGGSAQATATCAREVSRLSSPSTPLDTPSPLSGMILSGVFVLLIGDKIENHAC